MFLMCFYLLYSSCAYVLWFMRVILCIVICVSCTLIVIYDLKIVIYVCVLCFVHCASAFRSWKLRSFCLNKVRFLRIVIPVMKVEVFFFYLKSPILTHSHCRFYSYPVQIELWTNQCSKLSGVRGIDYLPWGWYNQFTRLANQITDRILNQSAPRLSRVNQRSTLFLICTGLCHFHDRSNRLSVFLPVPSHPPIAEGVILTWGWHNQLKR